MGNAGRIYEIVPLREDDPIFVDKDLIRDFTRLMEQVNRLKRTHFPQSFQSPMQLLCELYMKDRLRMRREV